MVQVWIVLRFRSSIAQEAFLLLQVRYDAETLRLDQTAG